MALVLLNELQEPKVLETTEDGSIGDMTTYTDRVVHVEPNAPTQIKVIWCYAYYRIPITRTSLEPAFQSRDMEAAPCPEISDVHDIVDDITGKVIGVGFTATAKVVDSWQCNVQAECTYFNSQMGRTYTHRRMASFTVSSQQDIDAVIERMSK